MAGQHWWAQAGYVIGLAPDALTYALPEMYVEANGNTYTFQSIAPAGWNTQHTFQVWISSSSGAANFAIDGNQVATIGMPLNFNQGGQLSNIIEVHQNGGSWDISTGGWSNLQYYECGIIGQSCWNSWDCGPNCTYVAVTSGYYGVQEISKTAFTTTFSHGSGGCGCQKL